MKTKKVLIILFIAIKSIYPLTAHALETEVKTSIDQQEEKFLENMVKEKIEKKNYKKIRINVNLNKQKKILFCKKKIKIKMLTPVKLWGSVTIKANCEQPKWSYKRRAKIKTQAYIPVAKERIFRNKIIKEGDIIWKWKNLIFNHENWVLEKKLLLGKRVIRHVPEGSTITNRQIAKKFLIKIGEEVTIVSLKNQWALITAKGVALENGVLGQEIKVRNITSKKIIRGKVSSKSKITV